MSNAELKNQLIKSIINIDDFSILSNMKEYVDKLTSDNSDWWNEISQQEKQAIQLSLKESDSEELIPHSKVNSKVNELLKKHE